AMLLDLRTEPFDVGCGDVVDQDHAVRVSDGEARHREWPSADVDRLDVVKADLAHIGGDFRHTSVAHRALDADASPFRVDREAVILGVPVLAQVLREDPDAVAALLRVTAV